MGARLEKVGQVWGRVKPYLPGFLVVLVVAGAILALIYVPKMQVPVCPPGKDGLPPKICFDIENEARKTLAYILGGILAIFGIYMAHRRIRALERQVQIGQEQLQVAQEGQITERFTRAIEQLGSDKMEVRLGGIYALERIANDSDKDYWTIMETLTAYVRERAPWREVQQGSEKSLFGPLPRPKPSTDIKAVLTVLVRRKYHLGQGETQPLDLSGTDLRGAYLWGAHLEEANLDSVHLEEAILDGAYLEKAYLSEAHLEGAFLREANLREADLSDAYMESANFTRAFLGRAELSGSDLKGGHLRGAYLFSATLRGTQMQGAILEQSHFEGADLENAHLEKASLIGTNLKGASLTGANLNGANLREAVGLNWEQLSWAIIDDKTRLPVYLQSHPPRPRDPRGMNEE